MFDALIISDYIIRRYSDEGHIVSNLKLQKLLYFVQAEFLICYRKPCFREKIVAWDFGPVVPEVYRKFCIFGSAHIPVSAVTNPVLSKETKELIDGIVFTCLPFSSPQLVEITNESILSFFEA